MIREFHLSPRGKGGISCDEHGAFVGAIPILHRLRRNGKDEWLPRDCDGLSEQMSAQYGLPIDMSPKTGGLKVIAKALNEGNVARAQIAAVLLGIPDPLPLSKGASSRQQMIELVCDLHWSGMLKWDSDEHPRWPVGSADSRGGKFAPKDTEADTSLAPRGTGRDTRSQLADAGMSDAVGDPVAEAAARAAEAAPADRDSFESWDMLAAPDGADRNSQSEDSVPQLIAAADAEEEKDPRFGLGGNHPPLEELIPERLVQSPAGPVLQFLDNLLDFSRPADEANLAVAQGQMSALLHAIHDVDPNYVYESIGPADGLAGMTWQERRNVINGLQAELAAAIYRVRGDIRPLQEVTLEFMQRATNAAYDKGVKLYDAGDLDFQLSREVTIGNYVDGRVREQLKDFFNNLGIQLDSDSSIRVNNRAYTLPDSRAPYRLPDARVGNFLFEVSLEAKKPWKPQIKDFLNTDFKPTGVVIVRPNQLGSNSSYIIWRRDGE